MTPIKAIRKHCIECHGGNQKAPANCPKLDCELYAYRLGKNPKRQGIGGKGGIKSNGGEIIGSRVGEKRQEIVVAGNKRVIIRIEEAE